MAASDSSLQFVSLLTLEQVGLAGGVWEEHSRIGLCEDGSRWLVKAATDEEIDEVLACELAKMFFNGVVPDTRWLVQSGVSLSAQRMVKGSSAHELNSGLYAAVRTESALRDLASMVVLDLVLGNQDRHGNNWFITDQGRIAAIDNGFADADIKFTDALKPVYKALLADDCGSTPGLIKMIREVVDRADGAGPDAVKLIQGSAVNRFRPAHDLSKRWQRRVDLAQDWLDRWSAELDRRCR